MSLIDKIPVLRKAIDLGSAMLIVIALSALVGLILAFPVMLLWNFVFGSFVKITVFQAWALNLLCSILFSQRSIKQ